MISYCLKYKKSPESLNPRGLKTNNNKIMLFSKCAIRDSKKLRFIIKKTRSKWITE